MKLRKNKTVSASCILTIPDEFCTEGNKSAGWTAENKADGIKGDEIMARVVKKKYGNIIELRRTSDIMNFMAKHE